MPADDRDDPPRGLATFTTYADGTPRDGDAWPEPEPAPGAWGDPIVLDPGGPYAPEPPSQRGRAWPKVAVGLGVAAALGAGFLVSRTGEPGPIESDQVAVAQARAPASRPMNVELAQAPPPEAPAPASDRTRLEVLPADMPPPRTAAGPPRPEPRVLVIGAPPAPAPAPPREVAQAPVARDATATAPGPASFDCGDAPTLAREMVCRDIGLGALDRRMKRAYAAAVAAGAPERDLRADQDDWLAVREEAARISRRSVVNIYRQRIDELQEMSDRGWP